MTDPFWMIMVLRCLGADYIVWHKAAESSSCSPGAAPCMRFMVEGCWRKSARPPARGRKYLHWFPVDVVGAQGDVVARVRKQLYIRRKRGR